MSQASLLNHLANIKTAHQMRCTRRVGKFESGWLAASQMGVTSKLFTREASMVPVYALLLFGGELQVKYVPAIMAFVCVLLAVDLYGCTGWEAAII